MKKLPLVELKLTTFRLLVWRLWVRIPPEPTASLKCKAVLTQMYNYIIHLHHKFKISCLMIKVTNFIKFKCTLMGTFKLLVIQI